MLYIIKLEDPKKIKVIMEDITIEELKQKIDNKEDFLIIDVREDWEFNDFNINGKLIPLGTLQGAIDDLDDWMEKDFLDIQSICEWNQEPKLIANVLDAKPFENLCWLINELHSCQSELKPGMIIITGSVFKVRQAKIGDTINHILSDHGKVSIEVV